MWNCWWKNYPVSSSSLSKKTRQALPPDYLGELFGRNRLPSSCAHCALSDLTYAWTGNLKLSARDWLWLDWNSSNWDTRPEGIQTNSFPALRSWRYVPLSESISLLITKMGIYFLVDRSRLMTPVLEIDLKGSGAEVLRRRPQFLVSLREMIWFKEGFLTMFVLSLFSIWEKRW